MSGNIHKAVKYDRNEFLEKLLKEGADVNSRNEDFDTPLHIAVCRKSKKTLETLLANGADVSAKDRLSKTPLDIAIAQNSAEIVKILLKYGVEQFLKKFTFSEALKNDYVALIKFFLEKDSNVEKVSESGKIPLHYAIEHKSEAAAHLLLDYGADANSKDAEGLSVLHKAVIHNASIELVDRLLENGASLNAKDIYGLTPLNYAVDGRHLELICFLLDKNPDLHDKGNKSAFCLSFIDNYRFENVIAIFINRGFTLRVEDFNDVSVPKKLFPFMEDEFKNKKFRTTVQGTLNKTANNVQEFEKLFLLYQVLKVSIKRGFIEIVNNLLTLVVNVNIPFTKGLTMLHYAVINGYLPIVEKLLACGADVNAIDEFNKMSALHFCVDHKREEIARVLLKNKANTEVRNRHWQTPLYLAVWTQNYEMTLLLLNAGANINPNLKTMNQFLYATCKNLRYVKVLIHFGAHIEHRNFLNLFVRFYCNSRNRLQCMKLLFNHIGISTDSSVMLNSKHFSHLSSRFQRLLIKYIAFWGSTIYYVESESKWRSFQMKCQEEIARMKLRRIEGFSISVDDILRRTPRQIAQCLKNEDFVHALDEMDFKTNFPLYWSKIKAHVKKAKVVKQLLESSSTYLDDILKLNLPILVKHKILFYFNDQELRSLIFLSHVDDVNKPSLQYEDDDVDDEGDEDDEDVGGFVTDDNHYNNDLVFSHSAPDYNDLIFRL